MAESGTQPDRVIEGRGTIAMPGLVDVHAHLREPGAETAETIETGCRAALAGGFTTIACMPNTTPPLDTPEMVEYVLAKSRDLGLARVAVVACATRGRAGRELADIAALARAGAVAVTDDGSGVQDSGLAAAAIQAAAAAGIVFAEHCENDSLSRGGAMHLGRVSRGLGFPGAPSAAEEWHVARDLMIAKSAGAPVHLQHISAAGSVRFIRQAKSRGVRVTAEATPHHLTLTDADVGQGDANFKMNPPLRTRDDVDALRAAVADGVVDCIATDHAPHTPADKAKGFLRAPCGVIGLETALAVVWTELVEPGVLTPLQVAERMSLNPARAFGLPGGSLAPGAAADVTIFRPDAEWVVDPDEFESLGRNCPFAGRTLCGRVEYTLVHGEVRYERHA